MEEGEGDRVEHVQTLVDFARLIASANVSHIFIRSLSLSLSLCLLSVCPNIFLSIYNLFIYTFIYTYI